MLATAPRRTVNLLERAIASFGRVDRDAGVIRGVKVIGTESKHGYSYTNDALRSAVPMYEGIRVYRDHAQNRLREMDEWVGVLRNPTFRDGGIYADLHLRRNHKSFEEICEAAENFPKAFGLSQHAEGVKSRRLGKVVVERIEAVHSVDIVSRPATTGGLFESLEGDVSAPLEDELDLAGLLAALRSVATTTRDSQSQELLAVALRKYQKYAKRCGITPASLRLAEAIDGYLHRSSPPSRSLSSGECVAVLRGWRPPATPLAESDAPTSSSRPLARGGVIAILRGYR